MANTIAKRINLFIIELFLTSPMARNGGHSGSVELINCDLLVVDLFLALLLLFHEAHYLCADLQQISAAGQLPDGDLCALRCCYQLSRCGIDPQCGIVRHALHTEYLVCGVGIDDDRVGRRFLSGGRNPWRVGEGDFDNVFHTLFSQQITLMVNQLYSVFYEDPFADSGNVFRSVGTGVSVLHGELVCCDR